MTSMFVWRVVAMATVLCLQMYSSMAKSDDFKRFLFATHPPCKLCYDCICLGNWAECLANDMHHQFVEDGCPRFWNHNQNCSAPYHQHGAWTAWANWDDCQGDCAHASRFRSRTCSNPPPANCGTDCSGESTQIAVCTPDACRNTTPTTVPSTTHIPATTATAAITEATTITDTTAYTATIARMTTNAISATSSTTSTTAGTASLTTNTTHVNTCNHACTVTAVGLNYTLTAADAPPCGDGRHAGSEALPIRCCHLAPAATWKKGENVLINCPHLPVYSPVAIFDGTRYLMETAGIFVGCLHNGETGFKLIRQTCVSTPQLVHLSITSNVFTGDAMKYYMIV